MKYIFVLYGMFLFTISCSKDGNQVLIRDKNSVDKVSQVDLERPDIQKSLEWDGTYMGVLPCASCPGIETKLTLNPDQTFVMVSKYQESDFDDEVINGTFDWNKNGYQISLNGKRDLQFRIEEGQVRFLDYNGAPVKEESEEFYILKKIK